MLGVVFAHLKRIILTEEAAPPAYMVPVACPKRQNVALRPCCSASNPVQQANLHLHSSKRTPHFRGIHEGERRD